MAGIPKTTKCIVCLYPALITEWLPPQGVEPHLREFECPKCGVFIYRKIAPEQLARETGQSTLETTAGQA